VAAPALRIWNYESQAHLLTYLMVSEVTETKSNEYQ